MFNKDFRPRRLRTSDTLRRMVRETRISADSLIWPIFIIEGEGICDEIPSLPGQYHYSPDMLGRAVERMRAHGVSRVLLFGLPKHKDENGSSAWDSNGVVQQGIRALRAIAPELYIITDVCMCEYTSHGHCGRMPTAVCIPFLAPSMKTGNTAVPLYTAYIAVKASRNGTTAACRVCKA